MLGLQEEPVMAGAGRGGTQADRGTRVGVSAGCRCSTPRFAVAQRDQAAMGAKVGVQVVHRLPVASDREGQLAR
jgi:hypothetical protein